jgi:beta-glucanase (GH16 family)
MNKHRLAILLLSLLLLNAGCSNPNNSTQIAQELKVSTPTKSNSMSDTTKSLTESQNNKALLGYKLVWSDEFQTSGKPDNKKWGYEQGFQRNHELQWYQDDNAFCENGLLVIEGRREQKLNPTFIPGSKDWKTKRKNINYTSSCLTSKQDWKYGRFEIKARIKTEAGLWPAIWFLGVEGQWPSNGEIDLMEYYDDKILANACWGTKKAFNAKWDSSKTPMTHFNNPNWDKKFHIWRMDWDKDFIKLYLDDELLNTIDLKKAINSTTKFGPKEPFQQNQYLLLNLAIGGQNGGDPKATAFPTRYEIDYVRIYQENK